MSFDVKEAQDIFKEDQSAWSDIKKEAQADLSFLSPGGMWEDADRKSRENDSLPALEIDKITQYVHQVVNDIRMNTPSINPMPVDDKADIETAKILKGVVKHIEYSSSADAAYDTGGEYGVKCGLGYIRVDHKFATDTGFEQELQICRVVNPLSITLDPDIIQPDGSDAMRAFALETISKRAYEASHPGEAFISFGENGKTAKDAITLAEFFRIDETELKSVLLDNGDIVEFKNGMKSGKDGVRLIRALKKRKVYRCKMNGEDILEETTFPGIYIPIVPVFGEEAWVNGKREIYSLIRRSKDAQRRYNHWASKEMEILQKAPVAPIQAVAGSIEKYAADWQDPSRAQVLRWDMYDAKGNQVPEPKRLMPPPVPAGIINAMAGANEDIKSTLGLYDASIGNRSNEVSGVAIENRQRKGDVATFHFGDNLVRSITQVGRILIWAIPEIYDTPRIVRIIGEEEDVQLVGINGKMVDGQEKSWNLKEAGRYDVRVTTGPSFTTKRQETQALMGDIMAKQPELTPVIGDLMFKNSDMPGADAIAARLKKYIEKINPGMIEQDDKEKIPPQAQAQMQQMQAQIQQDQLAMQQMQQALVQAQQELQQATAAADDKKTDFVLKHNDQQLKAASETKKAQLEEQKLALEAKKLEIEEGKLDLEAFRVTTEVQQKAQMPAEQPLPAAPAAPQPINIDLGDMAKTPEEKAQEKVQAEQDKIALMAGLQGIVEAVNSLTNAVNTPKQVVRGDDGKVIGVE